MVNIILIFFCKEGIHKMFYIRDIFTQPLPLFEKLYLYFEKYSASHSFQVSNGIG